jgi:hypothetical protein
MRQCANTPCALSGGKRDQEIGLARELVDQVPIPASGQTLIDPAAASEARLSYRAMRCPEAVTIFRVLTHVSMRQPTLTAVG